MKFSWSKAAITDHSVAAIKLNNRLGERNNTNTAEILAKILKTADLDGTKSLRRLRRVYYLG